ncbi:hypothetical protein [Nocardia sp. NPDC051832]|uniref:hypothetical protein n=1 Tax=Nocardia sp. NPDC051832 TaxID=3155673 RepID=UPI0034169006
MPPPVPAASAPQTRSSRAFPRMTAYGNGRPPADDGNRAPTGLVVRSHAGVGEFAEFDPRTGALRNGSLGLGAVSGLYDNVGDLPMVFYRDGGRLFLRAGDRLIDLDTQQIGVHWQHTDDRTTRFVLTVAGAIVCDVYYRAVLPDLDFGLLIRDVLTDPARRTRIFTA